MDFSIFLKISLFEYQNSSFQCFRSFLVNFVDLISSYIPDDKLSIFVRLLLSVSFWTHVPIHILCSKKKQNLLHRPTVLLTNSNKLTSLYFLTSNFICCAVVQHGVRLTATTLSYGKRRYSIPHRVETDINLVWNIWLHDVNFKFGGFKCNRLQRVGIFVGGGYQVWCERPKISTGAD